MLRVTCFGMIFLAGAGMAAARSEDQDRPTPEQRLAALMDAFRLASVANQAALRATADRNDRIRLTAERDATRAKYSTDLLALAQAEPRSKAVPLALAEIIGAQESHPEVMPALDQLRRDWLHTPEVAVACYDLSICDAPPAERLLRDILDQNPDRTARGLACYRLAGWLERAAEIPDRFDRFGRNPAIRRQIEAKFSPEELDSMRRRLPEMRRECRALIERAAREFADLPIHIDPSGKEERRIGPMARRWLDLHPEPAAGPTR